jgi:subtilisin family serine protease
MRLRLAALVTTASSIALAQHPDGAAVLRLTGPNAASVFAPQTGTVGALVPIPNGASASALGLDLVAPGIGRLRAEPSTILGFAAAHPDLHVEVMPPLHLLMDNAAGAVRSIQARTSMRFKATGIGALVGIVDTGLDVRHEDFKDPDTKKSRVAWLLDLSHPALGKHSELETKFGVRNSSGTLMGAVLTGADIDALGVNDFFPQDEVGHGTHVAGIAAGNHRTYTGIAPGAGLVIARVTASGTEAIESDNLVRGTSFVFDRADAEGKPIVANLSIGADFGPHDGTMYWEKLLASNVGPDHPGHAIVAAAGNSGSIAQFQVHEVAHASGSVRTSVAFTTGGTMTGAIQIWVTERAGSELRVGLDGPKGGIISPIEDGKQQGSNEGGLNAGIIHGSTAKNSIVPAESRGAVVVLSGTIAAGNYAVTLEGHGTAELYLQATGSAQATTGFLGGVREGTINLPATNPTIIGVGCTVSRPAWKSITTMNTMSGYGLPVPVLDSTGTHASPDAGTRKPEDGEICWFSSAGPNANGVPKPDIVAPGAAIISAMSAQATPGVATSVFTSANCPPTDRQCLEIDASHGVSLGTSMSTPMAAGAIALLFQRDPTLTQDKIRVLLQAGAHRIGATRDNPVDVTTYMDQSGPGELDVYSSLQALDEWNAPVGEPIPDNSWITLSADYVPADASIPVTAFVQLRTDDPFQRASDFDDSRLSPVVRIGGRTLEPVTIQRVAPGLFTYTVTIPSGFGGQSASFGALFDGQPIVAPVEVPIAIDPWAAKLDAGAGGGCMVASPPILDAALPIGAAIAAIAFGRKRKTRR